MQILPEFFQGSIAQDFQGILDADTSPEAGFGELAGGAKKPPKTCAPPCKEVSGTGCTRPVNRCRKKSTRGPICERRSIGNACSPPARCPNKKKAADFQPVVEGWSIPLTPAHPNAARDYFVALV